MEPSDFHVVDTLGQRFAAILRFWQTRQDYREF